MVGNDGVGIIVQALENIADGEQLLLGCLDEPGSALLLHVDVDHPVDDPEPMSVTAQVEAAACPGIIVVDDDGIAVVELAVVVRGDISTG